MTGKVAQETGQGCRDGIEAGDDEQSEDVVEVLTAELLPAGFGVHQPAEHVVTWIVALLTLVKGPVEVVLYPADGFGLLGGRHLRRIPLHQLVAEGELL